MSLTDPPAGAPADDIQRPLSAMTGEESGEPSGATGLPAGLDAGVPRRKIPVHTLLLVGVVAASAALLFIMRRAGMGPSVTMATDKIDYDLNAAPVGRTKEHERVLADLGSSRVALQVPSQQVKKNPFEMTFVVATPEDGAAPDRSAEIARAESERRQREAAARRQAIASALAALEVQGIVGGSTPVARVNDRVVRVGDVVGEFFTITAIRGRSIEVTIDGETHVVAMRQP